MSTKSANFVKKISDITPRILGVGYPSHIAQNATQNAADKTEYDFEALALKITSHRSSQAKRMKAFYDFAIEHKIYEGRSKSFRNDLIQTEQIQNKHLFFNVSTL